MGLTGFVIRSGLVVAAVYYSRQAGVWGSSVQSERLYNNIKAEISPHAHRLEKQLPFEIPALPERGELRYLSKHYYNEGVKSTFHFIQMIPCYIGQGVKKVRDTVEDFAKSPPVANESSSSASTSTKTAQK